MVEKVKWIHRRRKNGDLERVENVSNDDKIKSWELFKDKASWVGIGILIIFLIISIILVMNHVI